MQKKKVGIFIFSIKKALKPFYLFSVFFFLFIEEKQLKQFLYVIGNSCFKLPNELTSEPNLKSRQLRKRTLYLLELTERFLIVMVSLGRGDISRSASAKRALTWRMRLQNMPTIRSEDTLDRNRQEI